MSQNVHFCIQSKKYQKQFHRTRSSIDQILNKDKQIKIFSLSLRPQHVTKTRYAAYHL